MRLVRRGAEAPGPEARGQPGISKRPVQNDPAERGGADQIPRRVRAMRAAPHENLRDAPDRKARQRDAEEEIPILAEPELRVEPADAVETRPRDHDHGRPEKAPQEERFQHVAVVRGEDRLPTTAPSSSMATYPWYAAPAPGWRSNASTRRATLFGSQMSSASRNARYVPWLCRMPVFLATAAPALAWGMSVTRAPKAATRARVSSVDSSSTTMTSRLE